MNSPGGRIVWRVQSANGEAQLNAFDALVLTTDASVRPTLLPARLLGMSTPFERELPDANLTIIVRANDATSFLVSECDVFDATGKRRVYGRSGNSLAVFMCSDSGIMVTGLAGPNTDADGREPA